MIYIAAPFFKPEELEFVITIEDAFARKGIMFYSPRSEGILINQSAEEKAKNKRRIYETNIDNIVKSDIVVAVIDGRDTGTIFEMGFACGMKIPIISISNKGYGINVMLAECVRAHVSNINELLYALSNPVYKGKDIKDVF
jgi:nucleoside 2-deoxyribosyltransferase